MVGAEGGGREVEKRSQWVIRALVPRLEFTCIEEPCSKCLSM